MFGKCEQTRLSVRSSTLRKNPARAASITPIIIMTRITGIILPNV
jgi:hypothetical protein